VLQGQVVRDVFGLVGGKKHGSAIRQKNEAKGSYPNV
jgi:hypothetical protein